MYGYINLSRKETTREVRTDCKKREPKFKQSNLVDTKTGGVRTQAEQSSV